MKHAATVHRVTFVLGAMLAGSTTACGGGYVGSIGSTGIGGSGGDGANIGGAGGGEPNGGGAGTAGTGTGGAGTGAAGTGGAAGGPGSGGAKDAGRDAIGDANMGGARDAGAGADSSPPNDSAARTAFASCRFHFGTIDSVARRGGAALISELDYITPGWMLGSSFDHMGVCTEVNAGGALANKIPVVVAYVAAGNVKRDHRLCDCNVAGCAGGNLCQFGAQYIRQDWTKILTAYRSYSQGYASCYGTTKPIIFEMEPDWYQYTNSSQTQPWTAAQAGQYMAELVAALRTNLPNARFSMDVSPWVGPSNGGDSGAQWYSNFDMSLFTFVNTSGGGTNAGTAQIRSSNRMTWAGLHQVTGKPILADTGYGANGISAGHDPAWDVSANVNARITDGVASIAQYNPNAAWATTIAGIRSQLGLPSYCR